MKILDRYIARTVIGGTLMVLLVLGSLLAFVDFVAELDDVGKGHYSMFEAAIYVFLSLPKRLYELFPTAVLIGSLLSLGALAGNSELTVMRAAGVSIMRIALSVLRAGLILLLFVAIIGEFVVPLSERQAQTVRAKELKQNITLGGEGGFWARDGLRFIYVSHVYPGMNLGRINVYEFDEANQLKQITQARAARLVKDKWQLERVQKTDFTDQQTSSEMKQFEIWDSLLNPDLFDVVSVKPENMSAIDLYQYSNYLKDNDLESSHYDLAFWIKIFTPLSTLVMLLIALPFVFGSQRAAGTGGRVLFGLLLGIGFFLLNRTMNHLGQVYNVYPFVSASAPVFMVALLSLHALRKVK